MRAIILAGGKGTRLAPYTTVFPKPLLPVGDKPILEIILRQLAGHGFKDLVLCVGYHAELIQAYFHSSTSIPEDISINYIRENEPLGTAGPLALIPDFDETALVMNGDVLTTLDYTNLFSFHKEKGAVLTIAVHKKEVRMDLGIVEMDDDHKVKDYLEKPTYTHFDSMGIYVYEPAVMRYIEPGKYLDFPTLVKTLIQNDEPVLGYYHDKPHYWIDMGMHGEYEKANEDFEKHRSEFLPLSID